MLFLWAVEKLFLQWVPIKIVLRYRFAQINTRGKAMCYNSMNSRRDVRVARLPYGDAFVARSGFDDLCMVLV